MAAPLAPDLIQRISDIAGPGFVALMGDPELKYLLTAATNPQAPFSPARFQAALYKTNWWRKQSESQRQWSMKKAIDPAQARQEAASMQGAIRMQAQRMGVNMTNAEVNYTSEVALQRGITSATDPFVLNTIVGVRHHPGRTGPGQIKSLADQMSQYAQGQFFTKLSDATVGKWAEWVATGTKTMDDFQNAMRDQTMKSMPWMNSQLQQGMTLNDIVGPLRQIVANELEYSNPNQVNVMDDPQWRKLLGVRDSKGNMVMPTQSEVIAMARSKPEFWKTSNGRQMSSSLTSTLLQKFGQRSI